MEKFNGVIALDAMGGDYGPNVTIPAAIKAITELGIKVALVGDASEINSELEKYPKEISEKTKLKIKEILVKKDEGKIK